MERLSQHTETPRGLSANALRLWGYFCVLLGIAAKGIIQNGLLGLESMTNQQIFDVMNQSEGAMVMVTTSLALQLLESCGVPIFAFLLVEGFQKTSSFKHYLIRVGLVALVSEIPYNLTFHSRIIAMDSRNPVFGLVLGLLVLYFYHYLREKSLRNTLIKFCVTVAAVLWCEMLCIEHGTFTIIMTAAIWLMRGKPNFRTLVACGAAACGTIISLFYLAAPFSAITLHFYNGEKGETNRVFNLICYPLMLLVAAIAVYYL